MRLHNQVTRGVFMGKRICHLWSLCQEGKRDGNHGVRFLVHPEPTSSVLGSTWLAVVGYLVTAWSKEKWMDWRALFKPASDLHWRWGQESSYLRWCLSQNVPVPIWKASIWKRSHQLFTKQGWSDFLKIYFVVCVWMFCLHVYLYTTCPWRKIRGHRGLGARIGITSGCKPPDLGVGNWAWLL